MKHPAAVISPNPAAVVLHAAAVLIRAAVIAVMALNPAAAVMPAAAVNQCFNGNQFGTFTADDAAAFAGAVKEFNKTGIAVLLEQRPNLLWNKDSGRGFYPKLTDRNDCTVSVDNGVIWETCRATGLESFYGRIPDGYTNRAYIEDIYPLTLSQGRTINTVNAYLLGVFNAMLAVQGSEFVEFKGLGALRLNKTGSFSFRASSAVNIDPVGTNGQWTVLPFGNWIHGCDFSAGIPGNSTSNSGGTGSGTGSNGSGNNESNSGGNTNNGNGSNTQPVITPIQDPGGYFEFLEWRSVEPQSVANFTIWSRYGWNMVLYHQNRDDSGTGIKVESSRDNAGVQALERFSEPGQTVLICNRDNNGCLKVKQLKTLADFPFQFETYTNPVISIDLTSLTVPITDTAPSGKVRVISHTVTTPGKYWLQTRSSNYGRDTHIGKDSPFSDVSDNHFLRFGDVPDNSVLQRTYTLNTGETIVLELDVNTITAFDGKAPYRLPLEIS